MNVEAKVICVCCYKIYADTCAIIYSIYFCLCFCFVLLLLSFFCSLFPSLSLSRLFVSFHTKCKVFSFRPWGSIAGGKWKNRWCCGKATSLTTRSVYLTHSHTHTHTPTHTHTLEEWRQLRTLDKRHTDFLLPLSCYALN